MFFLLFGGSLFLLVTCKLLFDEYVWTGYFNIYGGFLLRIESWTLIGMSPWYKYYSYAVNTYLSNLDYNEANMAS